MKTIFFYNLITYDTTYFYSLNQIISQLNYYYIHKKKNVDNFSIKYFNLNEVAFHKFMVFFSKKIYLLIKLSHLF